MHPFIIDLSTIISQLWLSSLLAVRYILPRLNCYIAECVCGNVKPLDILHYRTGALCILRADRRRQTIAHNDQLVGLS